MQKHTWSVLVASLVLVVGLAMLSLMVSDALLFVFGLLLIITGGVAMIRAGRASESLR